MTKSKIFLYLCFSFIGILWQQLAQILSWPAWLLLTYIIKIVDFSSKIP
ncbi:hypothetical protein KJA16_02850 [Patescibacteria group bacterium]|nr:hypothetical protein [Patescibacteria group bacterium]